MLSKTVRLCVYGNEGEKVSLEEGAPTPLPQNAEPTFMENTLKLLWCAGGLLGCYLIWGVIQERIMAFKYGATDTSEGENFKNSQFLVFVNRILAFTVAVMYITIKRQPRHEAPLYKYSYSSFSNIMSSWFQYESLKFVSFPTQVLAKSCKVIPVMIMGKFVSNKTYHFFEYATALMISLGVGIFMLTSGDSVTDEGTSTTFSGLIILMGYLLFDAFTSNWQGELFTQYKMSSIQMMAGVNMFSVIFTSVSLIEQGGFFESAAFMFKYPEFVFHCIVLSICSAFGQLFIFHTISEFGAVVFTIIMTLRQGFAILLSCIIYHHPVTLWGICGIVLVFSAIFARIYCNKLQKKAAMAAKANAEKASAGMVIKT